MFNFTDLPPGPFVENDIWVISDETMEIICTINLAIICLGLSVFGMTTNIINIVVFLRMGFTETINISLFGLAISDLCSLLPILWVSICYNPFFIHTDLPVDSVDLNYYPGAWTQTIFSRITGFITVFITFERCLCIAFPLKVKQIMTRSRVTIVIVGIYVVTFATMIHSYFSTYIDWRWDPERNMTVLGVVITENMDKYNWITFHIQLVYPVFTYVSVVVFTLIFVWKLNHRGKWLQSATGKQERAATLRDQQVIKLVVAVAVIFIVCYVPSVSNFIVMILVPDINPGRKYENMFNVFCALIFPAMATNSSVNIFIYYRMMSKYKAVFQSVFRKKQTPPDKT